MMKTTSSSNISHRLTVSAETLAQMLDCGRATAVKIGKEAAARVQVGTRVLWNVDKIQRYLDNISTE